jgi:hypothetical protein
MPQSIGTTIKPNLDTPAPFGDTVAQRDPLTFDVNDGSVSGL